MWYYIIKVFIVPLAIFHGAERRTMFALQRNARSLYCTPWHLNPCVVHILANEHPSDQRPFTTVAPEREVIMYGVNPYKHFRGPPTQTPPEQEANAEKPGKPLSRRSDSNPVHSIARGQSLASGAR